MNEKKSIFSMRNIFKMLSLVCIVITFCPTFLVSCSGQKMDVSAMDLVTGISVYGEKSDPYPVCCIALALPGSDLRNHVHEVTGRQKIGPDHNGMCRNGYGGLDDRESGV